MVASSAPRLCTVTLSRTSSGPRLHIASTKTSKYRSSSKIPGVHDFILGLALASRPIRSHQVIVGKRRLRVLVEHLEIRVRRRRIEVVVQAPSRPRRGFPPAFDKPKRRCFENGIAPVPQRQGKTKPLPVIAESRQSVLPPAIGPAARLIVRQITPGIATRYSPRVPYPIAASLRYGPQRRHNVLPVESRFCSSMRDRSPWGSKEGAITRKPLPIFSRSGSGNRWKYRRMRQCYSRCVKATSDAAGRKG